VLTNGIDWQIYKIKFERPISYDLVCTLDLSAINPRKQEDQDKVFLLCKEGVAKAAIEEFHNHVQSVNRFIIGAIILSKPVLSLIRRELRRISTSIKVTEEEIENIVSSEVLKRDIIEGEFAEKAFKHVKKTLKQKTRRKPAKIKPEIMKENATISE